MRRTQKPNKQIVGFNSVANSYNTFPIKLNFPLLHLKNSMELLKTAKPHQHDPTRLTTAGSQSSPNIGQESSNRLSSSLHANNSQNVYVCVGKSLDKTRSLLLWTLKRFAPRALYFIHVHKQSPVIPTLLGKMPASQANPEVVSAYRRDEREETRKLLNTYLNLCHTAKVEASVLIIERDKIQKGIIEMVNRHGVRNLIMGATPENCLKITKSSGMVSYVVRNAPSFCEIWFVNKGNHLWTRESSEKLDSRPKEGAGSKILRSKSLMYTKTRLQAHRDYIRSDSSTSHNSFKLGNRDHDISIYAEEISRSRSSCQGTISLGSYSKDEEESLNDQYAEVTAKAAMFRNDAFKAKMKRRELEHEATEAISKVLIFESAHQYEVQCRNEAEGAIKTLIHEDQMLMKEKDELNRELKRTMVNIALLGNCVQDENFRHGQAVEELSTIQTSIVSLQQEKQKIQRQKIKAARWLEQWRSNRQARATMCNEFLAFVEELPKLAEFSLSDLQIATCNFAKKFKLGEGGYGCIYKAEMSGRTVVIQKTRSHNKQGEAEFRKEVQVLGKLQHPHLLTLLGSCPDARYLVYEYMPNGSLEEHLFQKCNIPPLTWRDRVRIIAEISSALCFLHSVKPEKIAHGNLKPQNILLDYELRCKICELGLVTKDILYCPSFRTSTESKSGCQYTDPEFQRIGVLTPKSDIYSFGVIILQLLTARHPFGLISDVRTTISYGKLASILDPSAGEWPMFVARRLVDMGLQFSDSNSRSRPDITPDVVSELERLHISEERVVPSCFLCPILQEIMHDPQIAADGFTYEAEAIRGWLRNGRKTSPMTNLKLSHLHLTPNHALRLAIKDWLCKS